MKGLKIPKLNIRREFCKTRLTKKLIFVVGCEIGGIRSSSSPQKVAC